VEGAWYSGPAQYAGGLIFCLSVFSGVQILSESISRAEGPDARLSGKGKNKVLSCWSAPLLQAYAFACASAFGLGKLLFLPQLPHTAASCNTSVLHLLMTLSSLGFVAASKGVNLPQPVAVHRQNNEFTLVLTDLEPQFPNKGTKGTMGIKELQVRSGHKEVKKRCILVPLGLHASISPTSMLKDP